MLAVHCGYEGIFKLLIGAGADVNAKDLDGETVQMKAMEEQNIMAVELLVNAGADVNAKDSLGQTVLMRAVQVIRYTSDTDMIELLIKLGADPSVKDKEGFSALVCALSKGNEKVVDILINEGCGH